MVSSSQNRVLTRIDTGRNWLFGVGETLLVSNGFFTDPLFRHPPPRQICPAFGSQSHPSITGGGTRGVVVHQQGGVDDAVEGGVGGWPSAAS